MIFSHFVGLYHDLAILCRHYPMRKTLYNLPFLLSNSLSPLQETEFRCPPASNNVQQTFLSFAFDVPRLSYHLDWSIRLFCWYIHSYMTCLRDNPATYDEGYL